MICSKKHCKCFRYLIAESGIQLSIQRIKVWWDWSFRKLKSDKIREFRNFKPVDDASLFLDWRNVLSSYSRELSTEEEAGPFPRTKLFLLAFLALSLFQWNWTDGYINPQLITPLLGVDKWSVWPWSFWSWPSPLPWTIIRA